MATSTDEYATKQDLYDLRGALREEMAELGDAMKARLDGLDTLISQQTEVNVKMLHILTGLADRFEAIHNRFDQQDQVNAATLPAVEAIAKHLGVPKD